MDNSKDLESQVRIADEWFGSAIKNINDINPEELHMHDDFIHFYEMEDNIFYYPKISSDAESLVNDIELLNQIVVEENISDSPIPAWKAWEASGGKSDEELRDAGREITPYTFGWHKTIHQENIMSYKNPKIQDLIFSIYKRINPPIVLASKHYAYKKGIDIGRLSPNSISKYDVGKFMGPHVDSYGDEREPVLSVVLYLNSDYEGGELYFPNQDIKIKPETGSAVVFPSVEPYFHTSLEIKSGYKYISPGFWYK